MTFCPSFSRNFSHIRTMSPHSGLPTVPTASASVISPILCGWAIASRIRSSVDGEEVSGGMTGGGLMAMSPTAATALTVVVGFVLMIVFMVVVVAAGAAATAPPLEFDAVA